MVDFAVLRTELTTDPLSLGYAGLSDQAAADKLNATNTGRTRNRTAVPTTEVFKQVEDGAWPSTAILQNKWAGVLSQPTVDASDPLVRGILGAIFPVGAATTATRNRLLALGTETVSRATELGLGAVTPGDVADARAKTGGW